MENITVKYYCPLRVNFMDYNPCRSDEIDYYELDRRSAVCYVNEIKKTVADYDDGNMAEYFDEDESAAKKLVSAYWSVEVVDGILYGCIEATLKEPFTAEEELYFKDYIEGQNSDGFGEGFEQQEIKVEDGWLTISYWHSGDGYFIYNEREFMKHLSKKQPCAFAYKETEKCRNYWWNSKPGDRISVAFLEFDCISIELNLEKDSEGNNGAYLFVCKNYGNEEWESAEYATSDIQEKLRMMESWDEVEDFMYNELIKYCEENDIDYTKSFIEEKKTIEIKEEKKMYNTKKRCPKCGGETFFVTAHVTQDWKVDGNGIFIVCTNECVETTHQPNDNDIWTCSSCGYDAAGSEFEIKVKKEVAMPQLSMRVDFRILKKHGEISGTPVYASLRKGDLSYIPVNGFTFTVNGLEIPFDFNATAINETLGIFRYESGEGEFFNDFGLSDVYDRDLGRVGLSRRDLTAEFLASASKINEFRLEFEMGYGSDDDEPAWSCYNEGKDPEFKVELLRVSFKDVDTEEEFAVRDSVLATFNRRE